MWVNHQHSESIPLHYSPLLSKTMAKKHYFPLLLSISIFIFTGCSEPKTSSVTVDPQNDEKPAKEITLADDANIVTALTNLGAELKKNRDGLITEVNLIGTNASDADLEQLGLLSQLTSLRLNETNISATGMEDVGKLTNLVNLDLRGCSINNESMKALEGLSQLRALRLSGESGSTTVDDDGMASINKLTSLKALLLDHLWISEVGLTDLADLKNLEELYLAKTLIDDASLAVLTQHPKLKKLRISQTQISDAGLESLVALENLTDLDLSENSIISDLGMEHVGKITTLKRLNLWRVALSDFGVGKLAGPKEIDWLNLDNTSLSDTGLIHLQGMAKITFLHLGSTTITDAGLVHLEGLTTLKDLKVTRTAVTEEGVASLNKKLPTTEIQLKYLGNGQ